MYGKIFASMYDGTLRTKWQALVTFQQMIVLADEDGVVDMTCESISARTGIPLGVIAEGAQFLEEPDKFSRSPDADGRRIERLNDHRPWGWRIVNYGKYRGIRSAEDRREYHRQYWHKRKDRLNSNSNGSTGTQQPQPIAEAEAEVLRNGQTPNGFDRFWALYPKKVKKKPAHDIWKRKRLDPLAEQICSDVAKRPATDAWKRGFVPDPTSYLQQERWNDEGIAEVRRWE